MPDFTNIITETWDHQIFLENELRVDVLRMDKIHAEISGNKWFKLKYYLEKSRQSGKTTLVSFGGAYSNHLLALAAAARLYGLRSIGIVRGEEPPRLSPTLISARENGMTLFFLPRAEFDSRKKLALPENGQQNPLDVWPDNDPDSLIIPEGGAGPEGIKGSEEILCLASTRDYDYICSAVGTGATLAGLTNSCGENQKIIGVSVLKGTQNMEPMDPQWINNKSRIDKVRIVHDHHFGGYAKYNALLIGFMNKLYAESGIPTDFVYTGKLVFAVISMAEMKLFPPGSRILVLHTGGLQGNRSLTPGLLGF